MAITILSHPPYQWQAAYNPIKYKIDSTNKNEPGFRYIVQIYDTGLTSSSDKLIEYDIAPNPLDSGTADIDISRVLRNKVDKYIDLDNDVVVNATGSFYRYDVKFGESYTFEWEFDHYISLTGSVAFTTDTTYGPGFSNATHPYVVGDQIYVEFTTTYNDCRDNISNGYYTITSVPSNKTIIINLSYTCTAFSVTPGTSRFSDERKTRLYNLESESEQGIINVAQDINEWMSATGSMAEYIIGSASTTQRFLTNVPDDFVVTENSHMWINMFENFTDDGVKLIFRNDTSDVFIKYNEGDWYVKQNSIGPGNLGTMSIFRGTFPLVKDDTEYYEIFLENSGGTQISEIKRFYIDRRCQINDIEMVFMDRKGSFMSFSFPLKRFEFIDTTKESYTKYIDHIYSSSDSVQTYYSEYKKRVRLNTNHLTEDMNIYFEELLTSPYTYLRIDDVFYSCKISQGTFETELKRNKRLRRRTIEVEYDVNTPINI